MTFIVSEQKTVTSRAQIVLDKEIRTLMGIKPGDRVVEVYDGRMVYIVPAPKNPAKALLGVIKKPKYTSQEMEEWLDQGELE